MITPPKHSYNTLNLGCFSTGTSPLFTSIDRTMTAIADSVPPPVSHCPRPSSVPSTAAVAGAVAAAAAGFTGHRDALGFLSTRITSPLSDGPLNSPTLDYKENASAATAYSLTTPPSSCGQQACKLYFSFLCVSVESRFGIC
ncbi:unnamed protein product [Echinostoma caproni]|uniref:Uncharacterized protein n=1 Tax=Echinostoma caproni TaxID=27848 RepID=A0A183AX00_9TREM|nr:unnamed protein product [Echinostoma caproni]